MDKLNALDYTVIAVYFTFLVGLALYLSKRASASLEDYFLGGKKLPWWALGVSGMASYLDITGTMVVTSFLFLLGPRGFYITFRGGAVLVLAFMMIWTGKWHRRSNCMTGAEWMSFRFGEGLGGHVARITSAVAQVLFTIGMLAYLVKGVGLFLSMFLPWGPTECALAMIGIATLYTMVSGFYGVVFTDMFQSVIILIAVVTISVMAVVALGAHGDLAGLAREVTNNAEWTRSSLPWRTEMPEGYKQYSVLGFVAFFYLLRNVIGGMGQTGADPKYFGARNERECGKLTFMWTWLMTFRWPMMMGFAVLGLFLIKDTFPDQSVLVEAAKMIKDHVPDIAKEQWEQVVAGIYKAPEAYPDLVTGLKGILGESWADKLKLVSFEGTVNPERILPAVLLFKIPMGFRGLLLVALIAASMSTFDSTVNTTAGYFTRDIYQRYLRPKAVNRELIGATYLFVIAMVVVGFLLGIYAKSITEIWDWIIMGLTVGLLIPGVLRLHWWRFNGGGFAVGTAVGMLCAFGWRLLEQADIIPGGLPAWIQFSILSVLSLAGCIIGAYLTEPTERKTLERFYRITRPFGLWGPLKRVLDPDVRGAMEREHRNDIAAVPFALGWQITLFLIPMQLIIGTYGPALITFGIFAACLVGLYFFWYKNLPPDTPV